MARTQLRSRRWALILLVFVATTYPARAGGITAGTVISNTSTVTYTVGGDSQPTETSNTITFTVDRKVDLTVSTNDGSAVIVSQGSSDKVLAFTVTNTGNDVQDIGLSAIALAGGAAKFTGTDNIDAAGISVAVESGATGGYQSGEDTASYIDELAADANKTVYIVASFGTGLTNGDVASYHLLAQIKEGGAASTEGGTLTQTPGGDTPGTVDIVFADGAGTDSTNDATRDSKHSDQSDYKVQAAALTVTKSSTVISDPVNNTTNPKAIPGAVVEYLITISNGAGSETATGISVTDDMDTEITNGTVAYKTDGYAAASGMQVTSPNLYSGAPTALTNASDADEGTYDSGTHVLTITGIELLANESASVRFRLTVQ